MILDCKTSVATAKCRMRAWPMTHSTRWPGIITSTPAASLSLMFWPMMLTPAWPKPRARRDPSLMMVFSSTLVSMIPLRLFASHLKNFLMLQPSCVLARALSSDLKDLSAMFTALSGSLRISLTFWIMSSSGYKTRWLASAARAIVATHSIMHRKPVRKSEFRASARKYGLMSKKKTRWHASMLLMGKLAGRNAFIWASRISDGHRTGRSTRPGIALARRERPSILVPALEQSVPQGAASALCAAGGIPP
mmetsp:Transcript_62004/g.192026  ORF Transcript_62004/g.192026 Transcript_62004/m.192026 type:complete len:250 (-) Transcript_62004:549-1298(-)